MRRSYETVEPKQAVFACSVDHTDEKILGAAIANGADYILSGDKHLLDMKVYEGIKIVNAAELMRVL